MTVTAVRTTTAAAAKASPIDQFSVILVATAAVLWAADAYFRGPLTADKHLTASQIVVVEDALVTLFLLPFLVSGWRQAGQLSWGGWLAVLIIGAGPQAIATVLFTKSFSYGIFAETFVLQQTQPLIAITLAWLILGERRRPWFWPAAVLALAAVYMVVFAPDLTQPLSTFQQGRLEAGLLALGAAVLWASGTVLGRFALNTISYPTMTSLRFTIALPVLLLIVLFQNGLAGFSHYRGGDFPNFLGIALIPGLAALLLYYRGLASTPASLATIAEMAFPVTATFIASAPPPWGFSQPVFPLQIVGTVLLLAVIVLLNVTKERAATVVARAPAA